MPTLQEAYAVGNLRYSTSLFSSPKRSLRLGTLYHRWKGNFASKNFMGAMPGAVNYALLLTIFRYMVATPVGVTIDYELLAMD